MQKDSPRLRLVEAGFIPILVILLIAVVGIGGYFLYTIYLKNQSNQTKPSSIPVATPNSVPTITPTPSQTPAGKTTNNKGLLRGSVNFIGDACAPSSQSRTPPCDGPYPDYEITVYQANGKTMVTKAISAKDGGYKVELVPGDYIIYTPRGASKDTKKENRFTITENQTTDLDLIIDTGIR